MEAGNNTSEGGQSLRATISIITRGGPVIVHGYQYTKSVLRRGTNLPAETIYEFINPIDNSYSNNQPASIQLFFGDNGEEDKDFSLGKFELKGLLPVFVTSSNRINVKLVVSKEQVVSIYLWDPVLLRCRSVGFVDISALAPPPADPKTTLSPAELNKVISEQITSIFLNQKPFPTKVPHPGKDLTQQLTLTFEEALHETRKELPAIHTEKCCHCQGDGIAPGKTTVPCETCQGTGWKKDEQQSKLGTVRHAVTCPLCKGRGVVIHDPCDHCQGSGWIKTTHAIPLVIPACIDDGTNMYILHQGEPGVNGGVPGHLRITVNVGEHPLFTRIGRDILIEVPISTNMARQGGHLHVPGIEKGIFHPLDIPPGIESGMSLPVLTGRDVSISARIETYRPAFLFAYPALQQRIRAIKEWLGNAEYEFPAGIR